MLILEPGAVIGRGWFGWRSRWVACHRQHGDTARSEHAADPCDTARSRGDGLGLVPGNAIQPIGMATF